jgi:hypothetical protein
MKYRELVNFEPIDTIVQLADSAERKKAAKLVESYVISDTMQVQLADIVFRELDPESAEEHKGLLIVGNYGTGKSHLMSFVSALAADKSLVALVRNEAVREAAERIAGKYAVIPTEIGGVTTKFRDIVVDRLQRHLDAVGVDFSIPESDAGLTNNKEWLRDMMDAYHAKFPDRGLLLVIDEMLDYLRALPHDQDLVLAFGVMRELGEFSNMRDESGALYGFHFIGGVQEAIFESGSFAFASDSIARVAERFRQVKIARSDVEYVVSERLLRKSAGQLARVEEHLAKFTRCYPGLTPRMEAFKRLFPVHPGFIAMFERIRCVEKRRILDTLSEKMKDLLDKDVPEDDPGVISFDEYWENVTADATARANSDTKAVMDAVSRIDAKIESGLNKLYAPTAHRVVNALAVHRLSQGDVNSRVGLDAAELREELFIYDPACADEPEPAEALAEQVKIAMKRLMKAVDGQYISINEGNGQYYIDVKKTVDVEQLIEKRAEKLDNGDLDRAYFAALCQLMEVSDDASYVPQYKIWEYDGVRWFSHNTFRRGYLFFGSPDERSTAQPPRDFYIYFLRPFDATPFKDEKRPEEVFFSLAKIDAEFKNLVARLAAATDLAQRETGSLKRAFADKADAFLSAIAKWMREKGLEAYSITYLGTRKKAYDWLANVDLRGKWGLSGNETFNFRDHTLAICSHLLEGCFSDQAREYPSFSKFISSLARPAAVRDSLRQLAGHPTKQGAVLLEGLRLLDGAGQVDVASSPFAQKIESRLEAAGEGKVVNRGDLVADIRGTEYFDPDGARLEPDLLVLVLAALVAMGRVVLAIPGKSFTALDMDELAAADVKDLAAFKHVSRPQGCNSDGMEAAFRHVGLPASCVQQVLMDKAEPVIQFQTRVKERIDRAAELLHRVGQGIAFLGVDLLSQPWARNASKRVSAAKSVLERMQPYDSIHKLKAISLTKAELDAAEPDVRFGEALHAVARLCNQSLATIDYLDKAADNCPENDAWLEKRNDTFQRLRESIVAAKGGPEGAVKCLKAAKADFDALEREWIGHYGELHRRAHLAEGEDVEKQRVRNMPALKTLADLATIDIVPDGELASLRAQLDRLAVCTRFSAEHLRSSPICPCGYSPKNDGTGTTASAVLKGLPKLIEALLGKWSDLVLSNLASPKVREQFDLLPADERDAVEEALKRKRLPQPIPAPLLRGLKTALGGLEKVTVSRQDLADALAKIGPAEPGRVRQAFEKFIDNAVAGRDDAKVRIVFE